MLSRSKETVGGTSTLDAHVAENREKMEVAHEPVANDYCPLDVNPSSLSKVEMVEARTTQRFYLYST